MDIIQFPLWPLITVQAVLLFVIVCEAFSGRKDSGFLRQTAFYGLLELPCIIGSMSLDIPWVRIVLNPASLLISAIYIKLYLVSIRRTGRKASSRRIPGVIAGLIAVGLLLSWLAVLFFGYPLVETLFPAISIKKMDIVINTSFLIFLFGSVLISFLWRFLRKRKQTPSLQSFTTSLTISPLDSDGLSEKEIDELLVSLKDPLKSRDEKNEIRRTLDLNALHALKRVRALEEKYPPLSNPAGAKQIDESIRILEESLKRLHIAETDHSSD